MPWCFFPCPDTSLSVMFSAPCWGCGRARAGHGAMAMAMESTSHTRNTACDRVVEPAWKTLHA